jgi:hypothetical protein
MLKGYVRIYDLNNFYFYFLIKKIGFKYKYHVFIFYKIL